MDIPTKLRRFLNRSSTSEPDSISYTERNRFEIESVKTKYESVTDQLETIERKLNDPLKSLKTWRNCLTIIITLSFISCLTASFTIFIWQGHVYRNARINNSVMIALLSSVTVDVIGLMYLLIRYVLDPKYYYNKN